MLKGLRFWQSVMKQSANLTTPLFRFLPNSNEWLLTACPRTINGEVMYVLSEYNEYADPKIGIASICVTKQQLEQYFYEDRKVDLN